MDEPLKKRLLSGILLPPGRKLEIGSWRKGLRVSPRLLFFLLILMTLVLLAILVTAYGF